MKAKTLLRSGLKLGMAGLLGWGTTGVGIAQDNDAPLLFAALSITTEAVPDWRRAAREATNARSVQITERANWQIKEPRRALTEAEAWNRFEAEYRPAHRSLSPIKRQLESGKYALDIITYRYDRIIRDLDRHLQFTLAPGEPRQAARPTANTQWLGNVRLKLDVKPQIGQPYLGVRLIVRFGN